MTAASTPRTSATPTGSTSPSAPSGTRRREPRNGGDQLPASMVERVTLILDSFEGRSARLTLEQVASRTRLPRSTAHRILDQLVRLRWLEHTSAGYALGQRALGLGGHDGSRGEVREVVAPMLHELHVRTGMVVHLAVLEDGDVVFLDKLGGRFATSLPSRVGGRAPASVTAIGKAMLAWCDPENVDALVRSRPTGQAPVDSAALHQELVRIRQRHGLAFEHGEAMPGVSAVAAAIRGADGPVAAVSLCGQERSAQPERVAPLVAEVVRESSRVLCPDRGRPRGASQDTGLVRDAWSDAALNRLLSTGQDGEWI